MNGSASWLHNRTLWFIARFNVYGIALSVLWSPFGTVLLQERVAQTTSQGFRDTALGIITFLGIGVAALTQPVAGQISDRAPLADRRRPFIVGATLVDLLFLLFVWWSPGLGWLFAAYVLLQLSTNVAQAGFQALIPDLVGPTDRGIASGIKNAYDLLGSIIGLAGVGLLLGAGVGTGGALAFIGAVLLLGAALALLWVPRVPPLPPGQRAGSLRELVDLRVIPKAFQLDFHAHRGFVLTVAVRFLFLLGVYPVQRFLLYFLQHRFGLRGVGEATSFYALGLLLIGALGAAAAGGLSDRFGRVNTLRLGILAGVLGLVGVAFSPSLPAMLGTGALMAVGIGTFQAVNWALLADHIPSGRGARFYGLSNIATAGASALAGLFGPLISLLSGATPLDSYTIVFSLGALLSLTSLWPLHRIRGTLRG